MSQQGKNLHTDHLWFNNNKLYLGISLWCNGKQVSFKEQLLISIEFNYYSVVIITTSIVSHYHTCALVPNLNNS